LAPIFFGLIPDVTFTQEVSKKSGETQKFSGPQENRGIVKLRNWEEKSLKRKNEMVNQRIQFGENQIRFKIELS